LAEARKLGPRIRAHPQQRLNMPPIPPTQVSPHERKLARSSKAREQALLPHSVLLEAGHGARGPPLAYRIDVFVLVSGVGRTATYEALKAGRLKAVKAGKRTLILGDSARAFIASLPPYRPLAAA
jgi:hypothetical protein